MSDEKLDEMAAVCRSMWHKTRKMFVPWTGEEIDRRCGAGSSMRQRLVALGYLQTPETRVTARSRETQIYSITEAGKRLAKMDGWIFE